MKKFVVCLLVLTLLLCGCGGNVEPFEPVVERPTIDLGEPQINPEGAVQEEIPTEAPVVDGEIGVRLEDQFSEVYSQINYEGSYCVHIPRFVVNGKSDLTINNNIYKDHMRVLQENSFDGQPTVSAYYALGVGDGYASVITRFNQQDYEFATYSIFHVNTQNGQEVSDNQLLAAFGYTPDSFRAAVRDVMEKQFVNYNADMRQSIGEDAYRQALSEHMADENIATARPFIDADGKLCIMVKFYTFAGAGYFYNRICLENPAHYPTPEQITCLEHQ